MGTDVHPTHVQIVSPVVGYHLIEFRIPWELNFNPGELNLNILVKILSESYLHISVLVLIVKSLFNQFRVPRCRPVHSIEHIQIALQRQSQIDSEPEVSILLRIDPIACLE